MAESSSRIARVESKVDQLSVDVHEMDTILRDGLRDTVRRIEEKVDAHINQKKPRRMEILTGVMALLLGLQTLGIFEGVRQAIANWLAG